MSGDKTLDGYQKKKYVCKLVFIFLLGHDIDFGHMEAVNLLSSNKYTEKQIVSILIKAVDVINGSQWIWWVFQFFLYLNRGTCSFLCWSVQAVTSWSWSFSPSRMIWLAGTPSTLFLLFNALPTLATRRWRMLLDMTYQNSLSLGELFTTNMFLFM